MKASISYKIGALQLLCQLPFLTFSWSQNQNDGDLSTALITLTGDGKDERSLNKNNEGAKFVSENNLMHHDVDRSLVDSFDSTFLATSEDANFSISLDDDDAEIQIVSIDEGEESLDNSNDTSIDILNSGGLSADRTEDDYLTILTVTSTINLELVETSSIMSNEQLQSFLDITRGFLSFHLFEKNKTPELIDSRGIDVILVRQKRAVNRRFLQQKKNNSTLPLNVHFQVVASVAEDALASDSSLSKDDFNFDEVIRKVFIEKEKEYVEALKFIDENYFSSLVNANLIQDHERTDDNHVDGNEEEVKDFANNQSKDGQENADPNIFPPPWSDEDIFGANESSEIEMVGVLSLGAMVGIIISILTLFVAIAILIYFNCCRKNQSDASTEKGYKKLWNRKSRLVDPADSVEENLIEPQQSSSDRIGDFTSNDDVESRAMYSHNPSHGSSGSVYTHGSQFKVHSSHSHSMSYAYSLEPGIEPSVAGSVLSDGKKKLSDQETPNDIPIQEIPQVSVPTNHKKDNIGLIKLTTPKQQQDYIMSDRFGNTQIETALSELKLTKSELEMLPSNLRSSGADESESDEKVRTRKILAPAGKLGVIIDTTIEGPIVHKVNHNSQLSGKIFPGDVIIAIDGVDTRAMSASDITAVMVKTADQNRTLTVRGAS